MQSSQVRNVGLPSSAEAKRDVPAWTQDPKIFPLDWFSVSRPNIIRQTKEYVSELSKWRNCPKIKTLSKLKAVLKRIMMFLHTHTSYIDGKSLLECDLEEDLITLVSLYMDMELRVLLIKKSALYGTTTSTGSGPDITLGSGFESDMDTAKTDKIVSDRMSYWLYTVLTGHDQRIDALLTTTVYTRHTRPVLDPIFRKILNEMPEGPFSNVNYVRHMLAYKTWRERVLVTDDSISEELNTRVLQQLVPRDYAFPPSLLRCLGKGEDARDHVRPHNVNLADACRNFMRVCREMPANTAEQINFGSIPLFDDDMLGDEENEVNKIMNMISNRKQRMTAQFSPRRSRSPEVDVFIDLTLPTSHSSSTYNRKVSSTGVPDVIDLTEEDEKPVISSLDPTTTASARLAPTVQRINTSKKSQPSQDCSYALAPSTAQVETRCFTAYRDQDIYLVNISCMCPVRAHRQRECHCQDKKVGYYKDNRALKTAITERKYEKDATFVGRCFQFSIGNKYSYPSEDDVDTEMEPLVVGNSTDQVKLEIKSSAAITCNTNNIDEERDNTTEFCDKLFSGSLKHCDCDGCKRREDNLTRYENRMCTSVESHNDSVDELSDINVRYKQKPIVTCTQRISHPSSVADMYAMEKTNPIILHSQPSTSFSKNDTLNYFSETLDKRKSFVKENNTYNYKQNLLKNEVNLSDNAKTEIRKIKLPVLETVCDKTEKNISSAKSVDNCISSINTVSTILQNEILKCKRDISLLSCDTKNTNLASTVSKKNVNVDYQKSSSTNLEVFTDSTNITVERTIYNKCSEQNEIPIVSTSNAQSNTSLSVSDCSLQVANPNFENLQECVEMSNKEHVETDNTNDKTIIQVSPFDVKLNCVSEDTVCTASQNTHTPQVPVEIIENIQEICSENFEQTPNMNNTLNMDQRKNEKDDNSTVNAISKQIDFVEHSTPIIKMITDSHVTVETVKDCDNHLKHIHSITSNPDCSYVEKDTGNSENFLPPVSSYSSDNSDSESKFSKIRKRKTALEKKKQVKIVTDFKDTQEKEYNLSPRKRQRRKTKINVHEIKNEENDLKRYTNQNKANKLATNIFSEGTDFISHNTNETGQQNVCSTTYEKNTIDESELVISNTIECDTTLENSNSTVCVENNSDVLYDDSELKESQTLTKNLNSISYEENDLTSVENSVLISDAIEYETAKINTNSIIYEKKLLMNEVTSEKSELITPPVIECEATEIITFDKSELSTSPVIECEVTEIITSEKSKLITSTSESEATEVITSGKLELFTSPEIDCVATEMIIYDKSELLTSPVIECEATEKSEHITSPVITEIITSEKSKLITSPILECEGTEMIIYEKSELISPIIECETTETLSSEIITSPVIECETTEIIASEESELTTLPIIEYEPTKIIPYEKSELLISPITECENSEIITSEKSELQSSPTIECESTEMITSEKSELLASPIIECETTEINTSPTVYKENYFNNDVITEESDMMLSHTVECETIEENASTTVYKENIDISQETKLISTQTDKYEDIQGNITHYINEENTDNYVSCEVENVSKKEIITDYISNDSISDQKFDTKNINKEVIITEKPIHRRKQNLKDVFKKEKLVKSHQTTNTISIDEKSLPKNQNTSILEEEQDNVKNKELYILCKNLTENEIKYLRNSKQSDNLILTDTTENQSKNQIKTKNKDLHNDDNVLNDIHKEEEQHEKNSMEKIEISQLNSTKKVKGKPSKIKFKKKTQFGTNDNKESLEDNLTSTAVSSDKKIKRSRGRPPKLVTNKFKFFSENFNLENLDTKTKNSVDNNLLENIPKTEEFITQSPNEISEEDMPLVHRISLSLKRNKLKSVKLNSSKMEISEYEDDLPLTKRKGKAKYKNVKKYTSFNTQSVDSHENLKNEKEHLPSVTTIKSKCFRDKLNQFKFQPKNRSVDNFLCEKHEDTFSSRKINSENKLKKTIKTYSNTKSSKTAELFSIPDVIKTPNIPSKKSKSITFSDEVTIIEIENYDYADDDNSDNTEKVKFIKRNQKPVLAKLRCTDNKNDNASINRAEIIKIKKFRSMSDNTMENSENNITQDNIKKGDRHCKNKNEILRSTEDLVKEIINKEHENSESIIDTNELKRLNDNKNYSIKNEIEDSYQIVDKSKKSFNEFKKKHSNLNVLPKKLLSKKAKEKLYNLQKNDMLVDSEDMNEKQDSEVNYDKMNQDYNNLQDLSNEDLKNEAKQVSELPLSECQKDRDQNQSILTEQEKDVNIAARIEIETNKDTNSLNIEPGIQFENKIDKKNTDSKISLNNIENTTKKTCTNLLYSTELKKIQKSKFPKFKFKINKNNLCLAKQSNKNTKNNKSSFSKMNKMHSILNKSKIIRGRSRKLKQSFSRNRSFKKTKKCKGIKTNISKQIETNNSENATTTSIENMKVVEVTTHTKEIDIIANPKFQSNNTEKQKSEINIKHDFETEKSIEQKFESAQIDNKSADMLYKPSNKIYEKHFDFYSDQDDVSNSELVIDTSAESSDAEDFNSENKTIHLTQAEIGPKPTKYHHSIAEIVNLNESSTAESIINNLERNSSENKLITQECKYIPLNTALNEDNIIPESVVHEEIINSQQVDLLNFQSFNENCNESTISDTNISKTITSQNQENIHESSLKSVAEKAIKEHISEFQCSDLKVNTCEEHAHLIEESEIKIKNDIKIDILKTFCAEVIELSEEICDDFYTETFIKESGKQMIVPHGPSMELSMNIEIGFESCTLSQELLQEEHAKEGCVKCSVNGKHKDNKRVTIWRLPQNNIKECMEECVALPEFSYCQAIECSEPDVCTLTAKIDSIKVSTDSPVLDNYNLCILADIAMNSVHLNTKTENNNVLDIAMEGTSKNDSQSKLQKDERCYYVTFTDKVPVANKAASSVSFVNSNTEEVSIMNVQKIAAGLNVKGTVLENKIQALTERAKGGSKINGENLDELYQSLENICELEISTITKNSSKSEGQNNTPSDSTSVDSVAVNHKIHEPNITIDIPNTALLHLTPDDDDFLIRNEPFTLHPPSLEACTENTQKDNTNLVAIGEDKNIYNVIDSITKDQNIINSEDENASNNTKIIKEPRPKTKKGKSKGKSLNNFNSDASYMLNKYKSNQDSNKNVDVNNQHISSNNKDKSTSPLSYIRSTRPMRMVTTRKRNVNVLENSCSEEPAKKVSASEKMFDKLLEEHKKELSKVKQINETQEETLSNMNVENTNKTTIPILDGTTKNTDTIPSHKTDTEDHNIPLPVLQYDSSNGYEQQNISNNQNCVEKKENILSNENEEKINISEINVKNLKENTSETDEGKSQENNKKDLLPNVSFSNEIKSAIQQPENIINSNETCKESNIILKKENETNIKVEIQTEKQITEEVVLSTIILETSKTDKPTEEQTTETVVLHTNVFNVPETDIKTEEQITDDVESNMIVTDISKINIEAEKSTVQQITEDVVANTIVGNVSEPSVEIENSVEEQIPQTIESNSINKTNTEAENNAEKEITEKVVPNTARNVSAIEVVQDWFNRVDGDKSKTDQYAEITYQTIEDCNFFEEVSNTSENSPNERKMEEKIFTEHQTPDSGIAFDEDSVQKDKSVPENLSDSDTCCPSEPVTTKTYFCTVNNAVLDQQKKIVNLQVVEPITYSKDSNMKLKVSISLERIKDILPLLEKQKIKKRKECIIDVEKGKKRKYSLEESNLNPLTRVQDCKIKKRKHENDANNIQECSIEEVLSPTSNQKDISVRTKGSVKEYPDCLFGITESPVPSGSFHSPYPSDISLTEEPTFYEEGGIDLCNDYPCYDSFEVLQEQQSLQREYNVVDDNPKDVQQGLQAGYCVVDSQFLPLSEYMNDGDYILIDNKIFNDKRMVPVNMHQVQPETKPHNTEEVKRSEFDDSEKEDSLSETVEEIIKNPNLFSEQSNAEVQVITMDQATSEVQVVITSDTDMNETYLFGITLQNEHTIDNISTTTVQESQQEPMDVQDKQTKIKVVSESCDTTTVISTNKSENEMFSYTSDVSVNNVLQPITAEVITINPDKTIAKNNKILEPSEESKNKDMDKEIKCERIKEKKCQTFRPRSQSTSESQHVNVSSLEPLSSSSTIKTYSKTTSPIPSSLTNLPTIQDRTKIFSKPCSSKIMKNEENINLEPKVYILKSSDKKMFSEISDSSLYQKKYDIQVKISEQKNLDQKLHATIHKLPLKKCDSIIAPLSTPPTDLKSTDPKTYTETCSSKITEDAFDKLKEEKSDILPPNNRTRYNNFSSSDNIKNRYRKDISLAERNRRYSFERDSPRTRLNSQGSSDTKRSHSAYTEPSPKPTYRLPPSDPTYRSSQYNYKKPNVKSIQPRAEHNTRSQTSSSHKDWLKNETLLNLIKTANTIYNKKY